MHTAIWKRGLAYFMIASLMLAAAGCGAGKTETSTDTSKAQEESADVSQTQEKSEDAAQTQKKEAEEVKKETEESSPAAAADEKAAQTAGAKIDYKSSEIYTKEDMDAAIGKIMDEFSTWEGCELHTLSYTDDQTCKDNLGYVNELDTDKNYTQCIVFVSSFHSPKEESGAWEPDYEYEGWQWFLARTEGGEWNLLTWGY